MPDGRHAASRTCIAERTECVPAASIRWFVGADGTPWPDWTGRGRVGGRGAWTCARSACVEEAARTRAFGKAFRQPLGPFDAATLLARCVALGERELWSRLGLANRAGKAAVGQTASREAIGSAGGGLVLAASDAGEAGIDRLVGNAAAKHVAVAWIQSGTRIGAALGKSFVSSVVVAPSAFAEDLLRWSEGLATFSESSVDRVDGGPRGVEAGSEVRSNRV